MTVITSRAPARRTPVTHRLDISGESAALAHLRWVDYALVISGFTIAIDHHDARANDCSRRRSLVIIRSREAY
jgi:hypothetical protein